jgi:hypothetical protein
MTLILATVSYSLQQKHNQHDKNESIVLLHWMKIQPHMREKITNYVSYQDLEFTIYTELLELKKTQKNLSIKIRERT